MKKINIMFFITIFFFTVPTVAQETREEEKESEEVESTVEEDSEIDPVLQEEVLFRRDTTYSEVQLNILNLLIFGALDVGYERIISDHTSAGVEIFSKVFNKNEGEDLDLSKIYAKDFSITGKFKYHFEEGYSAWGYYAQVFGMFSNGNNEVKMDFPNAETGELETKEVDMEYTDVAFGVGVGGKFVSKQGFLVDISFGIGRNLFDKYSPDIVLLPSVNLGYRF